MSERRKFLLYAIVIFFIVWQLILIAGTLTLKYALPGEWTEYRHVINLFFFIMGVATIFLLNWSLYGSKSKDPRKIVNSYLLAKIVKFVLTMVLLIIGMYVYPESKASFATVLIINYFLYMFLDIYIYYIHDKRNKIDRREKRS